MAYVSGKEKLDYIAPGFKKVEKKVESLPQSEQMQTQENVTAKSQLQIDMDALNLTDEVVTALYNESSKRMSIENFKSAAQGVIANLRATMSNNEIIDKIKCL